VPVSPGFIEDGFNMALEKIGISSAEAKRLVGRLIADGRIGVEGKRLRLVQTEELEILGK